METFFDYPERSSNEEVLTEILSFRENSLIIQLLEGFPDLAVILNKNRQIVAFNSHALKIFHAKSYLDILGKRVGEAIFCIHSNEIEGGCGTSIFCKECGAAQSIKKTKDQKEAAYSECRITTNVDGQECSLDLYVHTHPIVLNNQEYIIFAIREIANEKRREILEKIFFHDVLNSAGAVNGLAEMLPELSNPEEKDKFANLIKRSSQQLIREIQAQKELRNAEDGHLEVDIVPVSANNVISAVYDIFINHQLAEGRNIKIELLKPDLEIRTDESMLIRSLNNLMKNALEASDVSQEVKIYAAASPEHISFNIFNQKVIPQNVQLQLFQRSFSTKAKKGRGIGLYSVKLIIEQYLKGKVTFISRPVDGTVFSITLPINT